MRMWMRWSVVVASVGLGLLPVTGRAQDEAEVEAEVEAPSRSTVIMVQSVGEGLNLLALQPSGLGASVEHAVGSHVALAASVSGGARSIDPRLLGYGNSDSPNTLNWNVRVDPGLHFYVSGRAPEGFWVGPHLEAVLSRTRSFTTVLGPGGTYQTNTTSLSYGGSVRVGYTAVFSPGLAVQVGLGLAALSERIETTSDNPVIDLDTRPRYGWSVEPRLSVGLGWAF
jgi:hypothetical protein